MPALEIGGIALGMREGVIALIALVAIYIVFVLWRMRRLHGPAGKAEPTGEVGEDSERPSAAADAMQDAAWESPPSGMADEVLRQGLEQEVAQLRDEVDSIRGELAALREDMQQELGHMRAAQTVSPIYGDAMQMAVAGYDPAMIAERCGIARAEAELVVALARSQGQ